jgi:hypothetical protein
MLQGYIMIYVIYAIIKCFITFALGMFAIYGVGMFLVWFLSLFINIHEDRRK